MNILFKIKKHSVLFTCSLLLSIISSAQAKTKELTEAGFHQYVVTLKTEALKKGYETEFIEHTFSKVKGTKL